MYIYGTHPCYAVLKNKERIIEQILVCDKDIFNKKPFADILDMAKNDSRSVAKGFSQKKIKVVTKEQLSALVGKDAVHQGIVLDIQPLANLDISDITTQVTQQQLVVVLDCVSDPHNVGAILRSAAVFGASALITTERHSPKESATLAKTACGALEVVPMCVVKNLASTIKELKENGFWCVAFAEEAEKSLEQIDLTGKIALVLGAEGDGLRRLTASMCDFYVRLDAANNFSTLNVSNAAAIALYETFQQQKRKAV